MTSPFANPYQAVNAAPHYEGWGVRFTTCPNGDPFLAVGMSEFRARQMARELNLEAFKAEDQEGEQ